MKYTVINVDPNLHHFEGEHLSLFFKSEAKLIQNQCFSEKEVVAFSKCADALITAKAPVSRYVIKHLKRCKVIARTGAGTDNVDHNAATEYGIVVVYVPDFCVEEVANHALMYVLCCHKKLGFLDKSVRHGYWGFGLLHSLPALKNQILGLVGFGRISQALAKKAIALNMHVIAHDPYIPDIEFVQNKVDKVPLKDILTKSDYISLHIPLTEATICCIGQAQLALMKPTAYLINCARGPIIDESALVIALQERRIAGAALDCFNKEPPEKDNPLLEMDNVLLTPHSAAYSDNAISYLRRKTVEQVIQVLKCKKPEFIRNPEVLKVVKLT